MDDITRATLVAALAALNGYSNMVDGHSQNVSESTMDAMLDADATGSNAINAIRTLLAAN